MNIKYKLNINQIFKLPITFEIVFFTSKMLPIYFILSNDLRFKSLEAVFANLEQILVLVLNFP